MNRREFLQGIAASFVAFVTGKSKQTESKEDVLFDLLDQYAEMLEDAWKANAVGWEVEVPKCECPECKDRLWDELLPEPPDVPEVPTE